MDDAGQTVERQVPSEPSPVSPAEVDRVAVEQAPDPFEERPELYVGAALAGGFVLALLLRRIAGRR